AGGQARARRRHPFVRRPRKAVRSRLLPLAARASRRAARRDRPLRGVDRPFPAAGAPARAGRLRSARAGLRTWRALRTLVFRERLASSPSAVIQTTWRVAAPSRFAYDIEGGASGIAIGARRWDRVP